MKISILMPTYNDERYIALAIKSVIDQTYANWELLIMDDGSPDNTATVVKTFDDKRILFFQQSNQGQLRALNNLSQHITGDLVMMLHSDDKLYTKDTLEQNIKYFANPSVDGIYSSIILFYDSGKPDREIIYTKRLSKKAPQKLLILLSSNFIPDPFFIRKEKFFKNVQHNYLKWNFQYWLDFKNNDVTSLHLCYSKNPWYYYRIYNENYSNSIIGNFETFFGRLRSVYLLSDYYTIPFPAIQKEIARRFNVIGLVLPFKASKKHLAQLLKLLIKNMKKRTSDANTLYFDQLLSFYCRKSNKSIKLESKIESTYFGCDGRQFFNALNNNTVPPIYSEIISKYKNGFSTLIVNDEQEKKELNTILQFLCVRANVIIEKH